MYAWIELYTRRRDLRQRSAPTETPPGSREAGGAYALWRTERLGREGYDAPTHSKGDPMNSIVYIVGAVVIIVALLSFLGLR